MWRTLQRMTLLMVISLNAGTVRAEIPLVSGPAPGQVTLFYDPADGNLFVDGGGSPITTFVVQSDIGLLTAQRPPQLLGLFDKYEKNEMFWLTPSTLAWQSQDFGPAFPPGLGPEMASDLTVLGSFFPRGFFESVGLRIVPEPTGLVMLIPGILFLGWTRRARRARVYSQVSHG